MDHDEMNGAVDDARQELQQRSSACQAAKDRDATTNELGRHERKTSVVVKLMTPAELTWHRSGAPRASASASTASRSPDELNL
jgi:hypothetical protein